MRLGTRTTVLKEGTKNISHTVLTLFGRGRHLMLFFLLSAVVPLEWYSREITALLPYLSLLMRPGEQSSSCYLSAVPL